MDLEEVNPVVPHRKDWCDTALGVQGVLGSSSGVGFASLRGDPDSVQIHCVKVSYAKIILN